MTAPARDEGDLAGLSASNKFRLRAGSLSRTLLGKSPNSSKVNLHDLREEPSSQQGSPSASSVDGFPNASGSLPDRLRRLSSASSTNSTESRRSSNRRNSSTTSAGAPQTTTQQGTTASRPPAAPSQSYRRYARGSWNREPATQDEHVAQRLRALPRLSSYTSATPAPTAYLSSPRSEASSSLEAYPQLARPSTEVSDSALSSTEHESDDDMHDTDHHEDLESDIEQQSSPETEENDSPFFGQTHDSTPNTSPESVGDHSQEQQQQQQLGGSLQGQEHKGWTAFTSAATPMTARPSVVEASGTSYFDSRPSRSNDPTASPRDTLRTPTASRPTSSHQRRGRAPHPPESNFPLLSPRFEAGEMLEREAKDLREKLKVTQQFQLQPPPMSSEAKAPEPAVKRGSVSSVASSSASESIHSDEGPPSYDPGPPGVRKPYTAVHPRDDEGVESLPSYSCAVHIEGWMPRKCEFVKVGVQATNRAWKRQYIVLHGTSLRVLNGDPNEKHIRHVAPTAVRGAQAEPVQSYRPPTTDVATSRRRQSSGTGAPVEEAPQKLEDSDAPSAAGTATVTVKPEKLKNAGSRDIYVHEGHYDGAKSSLSKTLATKVLQKDNPDTLRHYTLQGAESGLAADYTKRSHCIRIRAEGEQFLIQAADDRGVIDWIEALQAATNISMDLDARPLPKFITLPRRRRRRRVADQTGREIGGPRAQEQSENAAAAAAGGATGSMGAEIAEEQRREVSAF